MIICGTCNNPFIPLPRGGKKYCSKICSRQRIGNRGKCGRPGKPKVECVCEQCGFKFIKFASQFEQGRGRFCSKICFNNSKRKPLLERQCQNCGLICRVSPYIMKRVKFYCSKLCGYEHIKTGELTTCNNCSDMFYIPRNIVNKKEIHYCSPACSHAGHSGERHHLYRHGIDHHLLRQHAEFTGTQKRDIYICDGGKCRACSSTNNLEYDHIVPVVAGGTRDITNGQLLCSECHTVKTTSERHLRRNECGILQTTTY